MTKRNLSIVSMLLQIVSLIYIFIAPVFSDAWDEYNLFEFFIRTSGFFSENYTIIVGIVFIVFLSVNLLLSITNIFKETNSLKSKKFILLPISVFVLYVTSYLYVYSIGADYFSENYIPVVIEIVFLLLNILVEAAKRFIVIPYHNNVDMKNNLSVEELKKYKELLDNGIITQEEFDAKKKQLLGL